MASGKKTKHSASRSRADTTNRQQSSLLIKAVREVGLYLFVACALVLLVSLYTYSPQDMAWSYSQSAEPGSQYRNAGGKIGAWFADIAYYLLGYLAFLLPVLVVLVGWLIYQGQKKQLSGLLISIRLTGFVMTLVAGCALASLYFLTNWIGFPESVSAGGILGLEVSGWLSQWFNLVGGTIVLLAVFLAGMTFLTGISWLAIMDFIGKYTLIITTWLGVQLKNMLAAFMRLMQQHMSEMSASRVDDLAYSAHDRPDPDSTQTLSHSSEAALSENTHDALQTQDKTAEKTVDRVVTGKKKSRILQSRGWGFAGIGNALRSIWQAGHRLLQGRGHEDVYSEVADGQKIEPSFDKITGVAGKGSVSDKAAQLHNSEEKKNPPTLVQKADEKKTVVDSASNVGRQSERTQKNIRIQTADVSRKQQQESPRVVEERQKQLFQHDQIDRLPALDLLDKPRPPAHFTTAEELEEMSRRIEEKLADYNMQVEVVEVQQGPVITRFELQLAPGIKVSQLTNLSKDLARALLVMSIRVVEVIAGKSTVGIEIPNKHREIISFYNVLNSPAYTNGKEVLPLALGYDIGGSPVVADLVKMPHLLVAGTTGSGKSVGINSMILSLLFHANPDNLRLIMVDPKMLELSIYEGIPHLLCPVVTDMMEAANALRWCVAEMERRYKLMAALGVRNIAGYNKKVQQASDAGEPILDPLFEPNPVMASLRPQELDTLPYIVIIIDEFADMMMIVGKKVEELIARLAQKARAAGLHLIIATQRPSVNVITGLIKANVPTRIAFQVSSKIDSRTILDQMGAETLLGNGDMLFLPPGTGMPQRVHGAFVSDEEVHAVVDDLKQKGSAEYIDEILSGETAEAGAGFEAAGNESDPLYDQAVALVLETRKASISSIQRRLKVGYNRAARMVEDMEAAGLVSKVMSNGQREVIVPPPS